MKYVPINCGLHDLYLAWATNRTPVTVTFTDEHGVLRTISGVITDVYPSKEGSACAGLLRLFHKTQFGMTWK